MVYEKSTRGFNEFANHQRTLSGRERQVLLLVNGVRNLDDLTKFFKQAHLFNIIDKLVTEGYIQQLHSLQKATTSNAATTKAALSLLNAQKRTQPICPEKLAYVKNILIEAADDYLGIMGNSIRAKIESCEGETSLRQCISNWHIAMRESKLGRESASFLMAQIHQSIKGSAQMQINV